MFASNFWTHDYQSGVGALFTQLNGGIKQNEDVLTMISTRMDAEKDFSDSLLEIRRMKLNTGFPKTEAHSSLNVAIDSCLMDSGEQALQHTRIKDELDKLVYVPLSKFAKAHASMIRESENLLTAKINAYQNLVSQYRKKRQVYFDAVSHRPVRGKDVEPDRLDSVVSTIRHLSERYRPNHESSIPSHLSLAGIDYSRDSRIKVLKKLIGDVNTINYKVPLLGSYSNVSTGSSIASSARRLLKNDSIAYSEKFGQGLVDHGLLKPIGQLSNKFSNSHNSYYQWQPLVYELVEESAPSTNASTETLTPPDEPYPEASPQLVNESEEYLQAIIELDIHRCNLEETIMDVYNYVERCEVDRIQTIKKALIAFNDITLKPDEVKWSKHQMQGVNERVNADAEIAALVENHRTGPYVPTVAVYEGTSQSAICQTFGVDLKFTAFFTPTILEYLKEPPSLDSWIKPYSLKDVNKVRSQLNTGRKFNTSILKFFKPGQLVATLKQYYLELPESLIPFTVYDLVKDVYSKQDVSSDLLYAILQKIPQVNLEVLNTLFTYLEYYSDHYDEISTALAGYLLRPRAVSAVTQSDKHPRLFIKDLLRYREQVFSRFSALPSAPEPQVKLGSPPPLVSRPSSRATLDTPDTRARSSSAGSAFEVKSATSLLPLSLSPDSRKSPSGKRSSTISTRRGVNISGVLPIGRGGNGGASFITSPTPSPMRSSTSSPRRTPLSSARQSREILPQEIHLHDEKAHARSSSYTQIESPTPSREDSSFAESHLTLTDSQTPTVPKPQKADDSLHSEISTPRVRPKNFSRDVTPDS